MAISVERSRLPMALRSLKPMKVRRRARTADPREGAATKRLGLRGTRRGSVRRLSNAMPDLLGRLTRGAVQLRAEAVGEGVRQRAPLRAGGELIQALGVALRRRGFAQPGAQRAQQVQTEDHVEAVVRREPRARCGARGRA